MDLLPSQVATHHVPRIELAVGAGALIVETPVDPILSYAIALPEGHDGLQCGASYAGTLMGGLLDLQFFDQAPYYLEVTHASGAVSAALIRYGLEDLVSGPGNAAANPRQRAVDLDTDGLIIFDEDDAGIANALCNGVSIPNGNKQPAGSGTSGELHSIACAAEEAAGEPVDLTMVSHGWTNCVKIGGSAGAEINSANVEQYGAALKGKVKSIHVYACTVGSNDTTNPGDSLLRKLADSACVDVCGYDACVHYGWTKHWSWSELGYVWRAHFYTSANKMLWTPGGGSDSNGRPQFEVTPAGPPIVRLPFGYGTPGFDVYSEFFAAWGPGVSFWDFDDDQTVGWSDLDLLFLALS